jgi:hypothetical protein
MAELYSGGSPAMTLDEFKTTLDVSRPPGGLSPALRALWYDARGEWDEAHRIAQGIDDASGAWVHAYLHRKEGDLTNADYWYGRAGQRRFDGPLDDEWSEMTAHFLRVL